MLIIKFDSNISLFKLDEFVLQFKEKYKNEEMQMNFKFSNTKLFVYIYRRTH